MFKAVGDGVIAPVGSIIRTMFRNVGGGTITPVGVWSFTGRILQIITYALDALGIRPRPQTNLKVHSNIRGHLNIRSYISSGGFNG
jgi:hypothetical protein